MDEQSRNIAAEMGLSAPAAAAKLRELAETDFSTFAQEPTREELRALIASGAVVPKKADQVDKP